MSPSAILLVVALLFLYGAERLLGGEGTSAWVVRVIAALSLAGALALRLRARKAATPGTTTHAAQSKLLWLSLGTLGALLLYALSTDAVVDGLALSTEAARRWSGVFGALWPIGVAVTLLPLLLVDRALVAQPEGLHARRVAVALDVGVVCALVVACVFPLNLIAHRLNDTTDLRYLKTTEVGEATLAVAGSLEEPVRVVLFFPPANEVQRELMPYFERLTGAAELLSLEVADQALQPDLAKNLRVSSNGTIALVKGTGKDADIERINIGQQLDGARQSLKKLDEKVHEKLLKLGRKARVAYFTAGHGEARWSGETEAVRKIGIFKQVLERLNYRVKELTLDQGLGREIPEDAALVIVAGARRAFLPEEVEALRAYHEGGGKLLVLFDAQSIDDPAAGEVFDPGLGPLLGVRFHPEQLHHARDHLVKVNGPTDRALLMTNAYSTHGSVSTLSRNKSRLIFVAPYSGWLETLTEQGKLTTPTIRTRSGAWPDADGNHALNAPEEKAAVYVIGTAAENKETGARNAALATLAAVSDAAVPNEANLQYVVDTVNWLTGDEALSGTVESEEDVRIEHSRDEDQAWFYGTSVLVPVIIIVAGLLRVRSRRRRS
ncbi:MAG: Gldg family protein [Deltaproteobacteria bacterium]|nr:Gldg family protein [Deltaproteobacteria bacterium]